MLWADTHKFTNVAHFLENISFKDRSSALALGDETGKHGYGRCLSGTVVAQQGEDLSVIHLDIEALHSLKAAREGLLQALNAKVVAVLLLTPANERRCFVVGLPDVLHFELVILGIIGGRQHIITCLLHSSALPAAAPVGSWQEAEDWRLALTVLER